MQQKKSLLIYAAIGFSPMASDEMDVRVEEFDGPVVLSGYTWMNPMDRISEWMLRQVCLYSSQDENILVGCVTKGSCEPLRQVGDRLVIEWRNQTDYRVYWLKTWEPEPVGELFFPFNPEAAPFESISVVRGRLLDCGDLHKSLALVPGGTARTVELPAIHRPMARQPALPDFLL
jgi:hypothetical protein